MTGHGTALIRKRDVETGHAGRVDVGARVATQNSMLNLPSSPLSGS